MNFDIIIEAKRLNTKQQSYDQMVKEIQAYYNEFEEDNKELYFIQLGGLHDLDDDENHLRKDGKEVTICKTDWTRLLDEIVTEKNKINHFKYPQINAYVRVLEDLIKGFEMHGFFKKVWFESIDIVNISSEIPQKLFSYAGETK